MEFYDFSLFSIFINFNYSPVLSSFAINIRKCSFETRSIKMPNRTEISNLQEVFLV